jgi:hypothetical protein
MSVELKKWTVYLLLLASVSNVLAQGASPRRDGNWWTRLPREAKAVFIVGMLDGMYVVHGQASAELGGVFNRVLVPKGCDNKCRDIRDKRSDEHLEAMEQKDRQLNSVTVSQLISGVDGVFADYRNRTLRIADILPTVVGSINGDASEMTEARLLGLRRKAAEN